MIPAEFDYLRAGSVRAALRALAAADGTCVLAGGQSLVPLLRMRLARPPRVVDVSRLTELGGIGLVRGGLRIGASATWREIASSPDLLAFWPAVAEAAGEIGDLQVRNRGTLGGGLAHADPAADMPAAILAAGAVIVLRSVRGTRRVPTDAFFAGPFETARAPDELITEVRIPAPRRGTGSAYVKFRQPASGFALAGAAAVVTVSRGRITRAALALTGVADRPFLAAAAAELVGQKSSDAELDGVAAAALEGVEPSPSLHAPGPYRLHLARTAARRALGAAVQRAVTPR